ncbi:hypothetical protein KBD11_00380 [Candidatus Saccharibacteria bacterium]|nr:hypothetical protein [Candidatus Saccharibacteria bacterium]
MGQIVDGKTVWSGHIPASMTHVYDIVTMNGTDLWMIGSKSISGVDHGQVWYSGDGGTSWSLSLDALPASSKNNVLRFTFAAPLNGKLYVQGYEFEAGASTMSGTVSYSWVFDGNRWSKVSAAGFALSSNAQPFNGKVLMTSGESNGSLQAFDGKTSTTVMNNSVNHTIGLDGYVYAITYNGMGEKSIVRSKDLLTWQSMTAAPSQSYSIGVDGDYIYVGTTDSKLYRASLSLHNADTVAPTVAFAAPATGTTVSGAIALQASASDSSSIAKVDFYAGNTFIGSTTTKADGGGKYYTIGWTPRGISNGDTTLSAVAYDLYGNSASSPPISVTVNMPVAAEDTKGPDTTITSPTDSTRIRKDVTISATATDPSNVTQIDIVFDGINLLSYRVPLPGSSASASVKSPPISRGTHTVSVIATDAIGNKSTKLYTLTK